MIAPVPVHCFSINLPSLGRDFCHSVKNVWLLISARDKVKCFFLEIYVCELIK